jgi:hypothetical protein
MSGGGSGSGADIGADYPGGSTAQRLNGSTARRFAGSPVRPVRRFDGSTVRRFDGSKARRLEGSKARRLEGSKARQISGPAGGKHAYPADKAPRKARWVRRLEPRPSWQGLPPDATIVTTRSPRDEVPRCVRVTGLG